MEELERKVLQTIKGYGMTAPGDHLIAGVSGGIDSVVLLHVLHSFAETLSIKITAVHVNHGLRGEDADYDADFVRDLCRKLEVPFKVFEADIRRLARDTGRSLEEAGRDYRYRCFREVLTEEGADRIAVAHHRDDVCETVLMNLCRGTGIRGLSGIPPVNGKIIRPLIDVSRAEIEAYAQFHHLSCRQDETNADTTYTRNRFRLDILPYLTAHVNNETARHIADMARDAAGISDYLEAEALRLMDGMVKREDGKLKVELSELLRLPRILQAEIILQILGEAAGRRRDISRTHIDAVLALAAGGSGRQVNLPYGLCAVRDYDQLLICRKAAGHEMAQQEEIAVSAPCSMKLQLEGADIPCAKGVFRLTMQVHQADKNLQIPKKRYTKWLDYDRMSHRLALRKRRSGDYLVLSDGSRKKLKRLLIDEKVSRNDRDELLLLAAGSHILWIPALDRISDDLKITDQTTHILEICLEEITDERESKSSDSGNGSK